VATNPPYPVIPTLLAGWLVIGWSGVEVWAQTATDVRAGSGHFRALVEHINQYSARVNAHFVQNVAAAPPADEKESPPPVSEESLRDLLAGLQAEVAGRQTGPLWAGDPAPVRPPDAADDLLPQDPVREARVRPAVLEETGRDARVRAATKLAADDRCRGHRLVPATVVANVIRILADCDLRLGHWPSERPGFYRDYRIPVAIGLPAPGGVPQLLEVVETHFGMQGRPNRATNTIDFTYVGIPHGP